MTWQVGVALLQPIEKLLNVEPAAGVAVSVSGFPTSKLPVQTSPQLSPVGLEVITPSPSPLLTMVTSTNLGLGTHWPV